MSALLTRRLGEVSEGIIITLEELLETLRPISNGNTLWIENTYLNIDDAVVEPSDGDGNSIRANKDDNNDEQLYNLEKPTRAKTSVRVWIRSYHEASNGMTVRLYVGETMQSANILQGTSYAWASIEFAGTWSKAEFNTLFQVGFIPAADEDQTQYVDVLYTDAI